MISLMLVARAAGRQVYTCIYTIINCIIITSVHLYYITPLFVRAGQRSYVDYCAEGGRSPRLFHDRHLVIAHARNNSDKYVHSNVCTSRC